MASAQRENELPDFNEHMRNLGQALGYPADQIEELIRSFQVFNRQDKYKLIVDTRQYVDSLIQVDRQLADLPNSILQPYMGEIGDNWKEMNKQLTQLQILSLIQKKEDCQEVIKELLRILNDKIRTVNSELEIVFTVSPVRHSRDGLIENNQSKAILIELIRRLTSNFKCSYFPSYEIVIDELRDYRFFKLDRVHPSEEAIEYVWKKFEACYCNEETINLNSKVSNFRRTLAHRSIHEGSQENKGQKIQFEIQLKEFLNKFSQIQF